MDKNGWRKIEDAPWNARPAFFCGRYEDGEWWFAAGAISDGECTEFGWDNPEISPQYFCIPEPPDA